MDRLAKIERSQLCKVVELAKPAKMVKGSPLAKFAKCNPKLVKDSQI